MKKTAFTLAETMIAILMVGILVAILIPIIAKNAPNKEEIMLKSAYHNLEKTVEYLINDVNLYPEEDKGFTVTSDTTKDFCDEFMNDISTIDVSAGTVESTKTECKFTTANGVEWQIEPYTFATTTSTAVISITPPKSTNTYNVELDAMGRIQVKDENVINILKKRFKVKGDD